jgi:hypothetical protein
MVATAQMEHLANLVIQGPQDREVFRVWLEIKE